MRPSRTLGLTLLLTSSLFGATIQGTVFLDQNGDGRRQAAEPPVAGAMVSDQFALVRSGADGGFTIDPDPRSEVLFVVNPAGTWPSSPWHLTVADVTGHVSFALRPMDQPDPVTFVQGTDMHVHPVARDKYEQYIAHVNASPYHPEFVVHTGDLVRDSNRVDRDEAVRLFDLYDAMTAELTVPHREVMGNHEVFGQTNPNVDPATPGYGKAMFHQRYGPATYAFRYGPYHFLTLDCTLTAPGQVSYGLTDESEAWAEAYLATVGAEEPVVLLVHEPLGGRDSERQLAGVLAGHRLVATLCGHGHNRSVGQWAGAPQVMGGAVSYAWHGYLPFPPQPWGYVVWRLDQGRAEWAFVDWAEERSIDTLQPWYANPVTGPVPIQGSVTDPNGDITSAAASLAGRTIPLTISREGALATLYAGHLDPAGLSDGVYDLILTAKAGDAGFSHTTPLVVVTGQRSDFQPGGDATLTLVVTGLANTDNRILLNDEPLADIPADQPRWAASIPVPAARLRRLNQITLRAANRDGDHDKLFLAAVALESGGRKFGDVRVPTTRPDPVVKDADGGFSRRAYVDLEYTGPRAAMP